MRVEAFAPAVSWGEIQQIARRVEDFGFDGLVHPEIAADPFIPLAMAAMVTERIELGTAIAVAFPRSPMVVANTAWDLHKHSGGRFVLGLGTQVKGHNERRFSVPWGKPRTRLREYVESLRAIWRCWERGEPLRYQGEHYRFSLMTPEFSPPPTGLAPIPVYTAAVRPAMMRLAGQVADGVRLHGFCTRRYMEEVALPAITEELAGAGRERAHFEICGGGFTATGADEEEVAKAVEWVRYRVAFYASTRTYRPVLSLHGWDDLGDKLHRMSKEGKWRRMAAEVPDEVVQAFTAIGTYENIAAAIEERFGGLSDSVALLVPPARRGDAGDAALDALRAAIVAVQRIPGGFQGHCPGWD